MIQQTLFDDENITFEQTTLEDARAEMIRTKMTGKATKCPVCDQTVKVYARTILGTQIRQLALLCSVGEPLHPKEINRRTNSLGCDYTKLRYWDLVEQDDEGLWYSTDKGLSFLRGEINVEKYKFTYNAQVVEYGESQEMVSARDSCGKKFSYDEIMSQAGFI